MQFKFDECLQQSVVKTHVGHVKRVQVLRQKGEKLVTQAPALPAIVAGVIEK